MALTRAQKNKVGTLRDAGVTGARRVFTQGLAGGQTGAEIVKANQPGTPAPAPAPTTGGWGGFTPPPAPAPAPAPAPTLGGGAWGNPFAGPGGTPGGNPYTNLTGNTSPGGGGGGGAVPGTQTGAIGPNNDTAGIQIPPERQTNQLGLQSLVPPAPAPASAPDTGTVATPGFPALPAPPPSFLPMTPQYESDQRNANDALSAAQNNIGNQQAIVARQLALGQQRLGTDRGYATKSQLEGLAERGISGSGMRPYLYQRDIGVPYGRAAQDMALGAGDQYGQLQGQMGQANLSYNQAMTEALLNRANMAAQNMPLSLPQYGYSTPPSYAPESAGTAPGGGGGGGGGGRRGRRGQGRRGRRNR